MINQLHLITNDILYYVFYRRSLVSDVFRSRHRATTLSDKQKLLEKSNIAARRKFDLLQSVSNFSITVSRIHFDLRDREACSNTEFYFPLELI